MNCSKCGVKKAVAKKPFTDQYMCLDCYMSDIYKRIKRNLSRSKQLEYRGKIAFLIPQPYLAYGLFALKIILAIEKKYESEIHIIMESCDDSKFVKDGSEKNVRIYALQAPEELRYLLKDENSIAWWRRYRAIAASSVLKLGFRSMVLPLCAEAASKMEISSILSSQLDGGGEEELYLLRPDGFSFVNALYGISCREVTLFSYMMFPEAYEEQLRAESRIGKSLVDEYANNILMSAIKWRSGEVLHSIDKSIAWLYGSQNVPKCKYCGGFSLKKNVCSYCEVFEDEKINVLLSQAELRECKQL
ncbi:MAG: hypothetical protein ACP5HH_02630 [Fervidicoccaceae archaeon]